MWEETKDERQQKITESQECSGGRPYTLLDKLSRWLPEKDFPNVP